VIGEFCQSGRSWGYPLKIALKPILQVIPKEHMADIFGGDSMDSIGYLRLPQVLKLFPVSKSTWWAGIASGRFPAGVKLSERTTAWRVEDIKKLLEKVGGNV
jgi:predicted DNA-binding transcriptional regulator AlpA